ncbi:MULTISPECIES: GNAT family N-acetyltransferase [Barrientosiimonas]|nr:GNAT family N-acetyltransferase [Barrientosiimonas endolithica]
MSGEERAEPDVVVRRADGDDLVAVVDIGRRTWPVTFGPIAGEDYVAMGLAKWWTQEATIPAIRQGRVSVAELRGEVVGMSSVGMNDHKLWMWKLYVLPEHQGAGVGGALMRAAVHKAAADGYDELWLSYLKGNDQAAAFYRHHGFTEVEEEHGGSGLPDSIVARRPITPEDATA